MSHRGIVESEACAERATTYLRPKKLMRSITMMMTDPRLMTCSFLLLEGEVLLINVAAGITPLPFGGRTELAGAGRWFVSGAVIRRG